MRKPVFLILLLSFSLLSIASYGQKKVKYKDIWGLLSNKQYEAAEPFLKTYLIENTDNPNAYLYMGLIYQEKALKDDVLKETGLAIKHMDSAIVFLNKSYSMINEKEIKRNEEYYQSYSRRDLRTGEFGIKLSDVQFDIEKRIEGIKERTDRVKMVKYYFTLSDSLYKKCTALYGEIVAPYDEEKQLILRAEKKTADDLKSLSMRFDSVLKAFDQYRGSVGTVGKIGYNQIITKNEIKKFKEEGAGPADFYKDDLQLWDYKLWADNIRLAIEKDIFVIRDHLVAYDMEINKLRDKLNSDSVSVKNDLTKLIDELLLEQLRKYDANPLPMAVFAVKIADLNYKSMRIDHKKFRDSLDLQLQLDVARQEAKSAKELDSLVSQILTRDFEKESLNYSYFITNTYSNTTVLKSFLKVMNDFSSRESEARQHRVGELENALQWLVVNESDSIPLRSDLISRRFYPLAIENEKFTTGLDLKDSVNTHGYFFTITPSRKPDIKISFPVDKNFKKSEVKSTKSLAYSDAAGQVFYVLIFNEKPGADNTHKATLAKIYRSDGLAWTSNISLAFVPKELSYKIESGEFVIKADASESVVDKNGKVLR